MATELAPITPSVLRWARESIGVSVDEAAKRADVTTDRVLQWEAGEAEPTVAKLRQLAKLYQRPLAVFFLPEPPTDFGVPHDFRRLPEQVDDSWSRPLHKVLRRASLQQEIAAELLEEDGEIPTPSVPASSIQVDPETAGEQARRALGVKLEQQFAWRQPEESFNGWLQAVESLGVLVLRTSEVPLDEMRGFSIGGERIPVIAVNALDSPRGQVFTLAHEFAHLMLREGGLCNLLEPTGGYARAVETWCNALAGSLLIPKVAFLDNEITGPAGTREWDEATLGQLSIRYGVSKEAVLRRLVTLHRATWEFYLARREEYLAAYETHREEEKKRRSASKGGPPPYRMAIRDRGRPYVRLVLDAYHREAITPSSLSDLLGLKLKHVPALERELKK